MDTAPREAHLIYHGAVTPEACHNAEVLCIDLTEKGFGVINLHICSQGGDVTSGVGLYNFLRMIPATVNTHAFGPCDSIAATIFLAGERRTVQPVSYFTLHAATYADGPRQGELAESTILISQPFRDIAGWTDEQVNAHFTPSNSVLQPEHARDMGIVHEIVNLQIPKGSTIVNVRMS